MRDYFELEQEKLNQIAHNAVAGINSQYIAQQPIRVGDLFYEAQTNSKAADQMETAINAILYQAIAGPLSLDTLKAILKDNIPEIVFPPLPEGEEERERLKIATVFEGEAVRHEIDFYAIADTCESIINMGELTQFVVKIHIMATALRAIAKNTLSGEMSREIAKTAYNLVNSPEEANQ